MVMVNGILWYSAFSQYWRTSQILAISQV